MSAFEPAVIIADIEDAGAQLHLMLYGDGSRRWSVVYGKARATDLPKLGALKDAQADALIEGIWRQGRSDRIHYASAATSAPR